MARPHLSRLLPAHPGAAPPWLWLWAALFLVRLPDRLDALLRHYRQNRGSAVLSPLDTALDRAFMAVYANLPILVEAAMTVALAAGVALALLPAASRAYVVRRNRLAPVTPAAAERPAMRGIIAFLGAHAPALAVSANLADTRRAAVVYPLGYRRNAVGVMGALVRIWTRDPAAGRAILRHEMAHHRHGDALLVNAGSPLILVVRLFPALVAAVLCLDLLSTLATRLAMIDRAVAAEAGGWVALLSGGGGRTGTFLGDVVLPLLGADMIGTVRSALERAALYVLTLIAMMLPVVAAVWSVELDADRAALEDEADRPAYRAWLEGHRARPAWRRVVPRLQTLLSHPPLALRLWAVRHAGGWAPAALMLGLFPLSWVAALLLSLLVNAVSLARSGLPWGVIAGQTDDWLLGGLGVAAPALLASAALLAAWAALRRRAPGPRAPLTAYAAVAVVALALGSAGLAGRIAGPSGPGTTGPAVATDRPVYRAGEMIEIRFSGLPGHATDWITVVPGSAPPDTWGDWAWTEGRPDGTVVKQALAPGAYEARAYIAWPEGGFEIQAAAGFTVVP